MKNKMDESFPKSKAHDQAFKELSDKYRRLQAIIPGMVYIFALHPDGTYSFLYVNAASRELFDIEPDDLMQKWALLSDLIHPEDRERFEKSLNHSAKTLLPFREKLRHIVKGKVRWYDCMSRPEAQPNGDILWDGIILEITDQMKPVEALRESEKKLSDIISASPVGIAIHDGSGQCIAANDSFARMIGATKQQVLKKNYNKVESWKKSGMLDMARTAVRTQSARRHEIVTTSSFGKEVFLDCHLVPFGEKGLLVMAQDIFERKRMEDALRESEERFRSTFEQAAVGIAHVGLDGKWIRVNQRLCDVVGYSCEELMNLSSHDITYPDDLEADLGYVRQMLDGEIQAYAMEKRYIRKNGSLIWINLTVSLVKHVSGEPNHFISVIEDISARKDSENAQQAHLQLLKSMERIDETVRSATDLDQMMSDVLDVVLSIFGCDRAWLLYPGDTDSPYWRVPMQRTVPEYPLSEFVNSELPMQPWIFKILKRVIASDGAVKLGPKEKAPVPSEGRDQFQIQSIIAMAVYPKGDKPWVFGLHQCSFARIWSVDETTLFQEIGRRIADSLTNLLAFRRLQKSEDRFRTLVENIPGFVYRCELEAPWKLVYVSEAAHDLTGYPARDFVENQTVNFGELILPEDLPMVERVVDQSIKDRIPYEISYRIRHVSGSMRWVHEQGRATYKKDGTPALLDGVIVDITERKLADEALRKSEATLRNIYESAPLLMGIVELTKDDKIVHIYDNPATARFFNLEYKSTKSRVAEEMGAPSEAIDEWIVRYRQSQQEGKPVRFEYSHSTPGGPLWLSATVSEIGPGQNERVRFSYVAEDITGRKQGEMQLQQYAETQAVLLREVNHRVKNNLAVIVGMLHKEEDLAKRRRKTSFLPILQDLEWRIKGLLTVHSMFSATNWQPLLLNQLCERIISVVLKPHTTNIKLIVSASPVRVDSNQAHHLSMVINELATNSLKYAISEPAQTIIHVDITETAGKAMLTFRDNGPGYPEEIVNGNSAGTGIGFNLMTGIVKKSLRGTLSFRNENGAVAELGFDTTLKPGEPDDDDR